MQSIMWKSRNHEDRGDHCDYEGEDGYLVI
jgi:hypothetical protein